MNEVIYPSITLVEGGKKLNGSIKIQGDKTIAVHTLFAILFFPNTKFVFRNFPNCSDVTRIIHWIQINNFANINLDNDRLIFEGNYYPSIIDISSINSIRSSICLLIPLTLLHKRIIFSKVGGCNFTDRPIDRHLALAKEFGIQIIEHDGFYEAILIIKKKQINFDCSIIGLTSVGVTCHALMSALVFDGVVNLTNVSIEDSVSFLINVLKNKVNVSLDKKNRKILINPICKLPQKMVYKTIPFDASVAFTYISAVILTKGELAIQGSMRLPKKFKSLLTALNINHRKQNNENIFWSDGLANPKMIICEPAPGIPTDCGPILTALVCNIEGYCVIYDKVYNFRKSHIEPLQKMGYDVYFKLNTSYTHGKKPNNSFLTIKATDIRAGAAILVAALTRDASTEIINFNEVCRGYSNIIENLHALGATIKLL